ncbi:hypothetical protein D8780_01495 [Notoacmeibacter ruber]|uniref:Uncharacterized protein n=2 Tax=Notoacmeibacter ruber TaxID=2670375 RepID=A0A3L7J8T1_9HYPH|nr:hypothetical protein D8780_01495 [Notoacmeibacter ruber]
MAFIKRQIRNPKIESIELCHALTGSAWAVKKLIEDGNGQFLDQYLSADPNGAWPLWLDQQDEPD